jgi:transcriptional regulator with XRE-family HTH domain
VDEKFQKYLKNFGQNVKLKREKMGMTRQELAQRVQISVDTLGKIENGMTNMKVTTFCMLVHVLTFNKDDLKFPT